MFAYCNNNPVVSRDESGETSIAADPKTSYFGWRGDAGSGGGAVPVEYLVVGAIGLLLDVVGGICDAVLSKKNNSAVNKAQSLITYASTAASPPPPGKGGKGTQIVSKTLYTKYGKKGYHIDVENPGGRPGQIHLQFNQGGDKFYYNITEQVFRVGSSSGPLAPNAVQNLLKEPEVIIAIGKGLTFLGY